MAKNTTFADVERKFHSMPQTKFDIPEGLEAEWLSTAVADYELNLGCDLDYDEDTREFGGKLNNTAIRTLAQMMYVSYLQRELDRVSKLNGFYGKDVQFTGQDGTKRVTSQMVEEQVSLVETLLHRQKTAAYG